ncbi:unnamed protein product [Lymnaea stagnalis]|uniref:EF-hand domain-containing protein n=1 Tax=Lymnaea stagnalis TaxID=6523 RepID=A0AAV2HD66_LYMST
MCKLPIIFVVYVMTGTSCGVFYFKNNEPGYPRVGKRAYYTDDKPFPRIGRHYESPQILFPTVQFSDLSALDKKGVFTQGASGYPRLGRRDDDAFDGKRGVFTQGAVGYPRIGRQLEEAFSGKRGVFTQGAVGYPRIGRGDEEDSLNETGEKSMEEILSRKDDEEFSKSFRGQGRAKITSPIDIFFNELDADNDGKITKEEIEAGMEIDKSQI